MPGATIAVFGSVTGFASGSSPVQFTAKPNISITAGTPYWIHARGEGDATGIWLGSPTGGGFRAIGIDGGATLIVEPIPANIGQGGIRFEVSSLCYANCDGSTSQPLLTANDFQRRLYKFSSNNPYANCDRSTVQPILTASDFICFLHAHGAGCF